ncbi:hypothetical protein P171DRAFT_527089 [Karstenula rhodostoma CBS 690.94]|uniref:Uncharacterized protein n=1 Tax=Karstenula rhodostoma CBS 690.94 TaxID=1392251 RepID=A0A9P4P609_9PLEO|nr:hypothetical protein P171DRAFT_527089 [Karstenula rhodostoma CBS 690.94]
MTETIFDPTLLLQRGNGISSGLSPSMTPSELAVAVNYIMTTWWPQLCRSSRTQMMKDTGMFEEGWYDADGLLDIQNPAFWKIVNALGTLYAKIDTRYPNDDIRTFRIRWIVARRGDTVALLAEGPPAGKKDPNGKPAMKGFRIKGPRDGWLDFQMELDVLKAQRDAADETMDPEAAAIAPKMVINGDGALIHASTSGPAGGPAFSPAQRKDIAEQVGAALSDDEQTAVNVGKWIVDQGLVGENAGDERTVDGAGEATLEASTALVDTAAVLDMEDDDDDDDEDWVKVGEGDEADDFTVPVGSTYVYKKEDAKKPRKSWWFGRWYY